MREGFSAINPYWDKDFFQFFSVFFSRLFYLLTGQLSLTDLASDEVQVFVLALVAISCGLLGVFLVLRKITMLANSLSHTILLGIVLAFVITRSLATYAGEEFSINFEILLIAALISAFLTTLFTQFLTHTVHLQEDASIGLVFTSLFAFGVVLVTSLSRSSHIGIEAVMGNVDALHVTDLKLIGLVTLINALAFSVFFKEFQLTSFDSVLATSLGISAKFFNYLIMVLVAMTSIGAFRAVGVLLVLSFLVAPAISARLLTNNLKTLLFLACSLGLFCSLCGVALSRHILSFYHIPLSTAGIVVTLMTLCYTLILVAKKTLKLAAKKRRA